MVLFMVVSIDVEPSGVLFVFCKAIFSPIFPIKCLMVLILKDMSLSDLICCEAWNKVPVGNVL